MRAIILYKNLTVTVDHSKFKSYGNNEKQFFLTNGPLMALICSFQNIESAQGYASAHKNANVCIQANSHRKEEQFH